MEKNTLLEYRSVVELQLIKKILELSKDSCIPKKKILNLFDIITQEKKERHNK